MVPPHGPSSGFPYRLMVANCPPLKLCELFSGQPVRVSGGLSVLHCPHIATSLSVWVSQVLCVLVCFWPRFSAGLFFCLPFLGSASALLTPLVSLGFCTARGQPWGPPAALTSPVCPFTPSRTLPLPVGSHRAIFSSQQQGNVLSLQGALSQCPSPWSQPECQKLGTGGLMVALPS